MIITIHNRVSSIQAALERALGAFSNKSTHLAKKPNYPQLYFFHTAHWYNNMDEPNSMPKYQHTREEFMQTFNLLAQQLSQDELMRKMPIQGKQWFDKMLQYNVPGGKLNRGMAVLDVYRAIKGEAESKDIISKCNIIGWCIEFLQAFFLVADDIMDSSITRRGQPCWYRVPEVGMVACNDYIIIESCIYRILSINMSKEKYYTQLLNLFHEATHLTALGQMLDLITAPPDKVDLSRFTMDTYMSIVTHKTAYYSFYLPAACGMLLAGISPDEQPEAFEQAKSILVQMGQFFQVQDDVLDCFGTPEDIGKIGTDIEDNKCSWLVCQALSLASEEQKQGIRDNYGKKEPEKVAIIKRIYKELDLERVFHDYEERSYEELTKEIESQNLLPKNVFTALLLKIYKRKK